MADARVGGAYLDFFTRNARLISGLKRNVEALRRQQRAIRALRRDLRTFNSEARLFARRAVILAGILAGAGVASFSAFGKAMAQVRGVTQATRVEYELLRKQALDLGRVTQYTATQAAEGQLFLARTGFDVTEVYQALPGTLRIAQAAVVEVGEAADFVTNALAGFGEQADKTAAFVDVLAATTIGANTDLYQLADALNLSAPNAKALGLNIVETAAAIGVLSNSGLQATKAGTGLSRVLFILTQPSVSLTKTLNSLGLTMEQVSIQNRGLIEVLETLNKSGIEAGQIFKLFGARGSPAFINLSQNVAVLRLLNEEFGSMAGITAELSAIMDDTLALATLRVISAGAGLAITFLEISGAGNSMKEALNAIARSINTVTDNLGTYVGRDRKGDRAAGWPCAAEDLDRPGVYRDHQEHPYPDRLSWFSKQDRDLGAPSVYSFFRFAGARLSADTAFRNTSDNRVYPVKAPGGSRCGLDGESGDQRQDNPGRRPGNRHECRQAAYGVVCRAFQSDQKIRFPPAHHRGDIPGDQSILPFPGGAQEIRRLVRRHLRRVFHRSGV